MDSGSKPGGKKDSIGVPGGTILILSFYPEEFRADSDILFKWVRAVFALRFCLPHRQGLLQLPFDR